MADQKTETPAARADETETAAPAAVEAAEAAPKAAEASKPAPAAPARVKAAAARAVPAPARAATPARAARRAQPKAVAKAAAAPKARKAKTIQSKRNTQTRGTQTMKTETNKIADRVQAAFGDVNERAKTAFERNARFAEELTELSKGNVEALVASTKVAARGVETIGQEVAELSRKSFEEASAALRGFAEVKSPTDFFRLQGDYARGQFDTFVAESAKLSEAMIKLAGDVAQPLTSRYTVAADKVKTAVAF
jgi:phasin family protein